MNQYTADESITKKLFRATHRQHRDDRKAATAFRSIFSPVSTYLRYSITSIDNTERIEAREPVRVYSPFSLPVFVDNDARPLRPDDAPITSVEPQRD